MVNVGVAWSVASSLQLKGNATLQFHDNNLSHSFNIYDQNPCFIPSFAKKTKVLILQAIEAEMRETRLITAAGQSLA